jgi:adenylate cyclase class IV
MYKRKNSIILLLRFLIIYDILLKGDFMKQIEITLKVNNTLDEVLKLLEDKGFKKIRESEVYDIYMTQCLNELTLDNIEYVLSKCVLLRYLNANSKVFKKITYKNKIFEKGNFISEEKINLACDNLELAEKLFKALEFEELVKVKYNVTVMAKDDMEFAFQEVDGLGLLVEYENNEDFENIDNEKIINIKQEMKKEIENYGIDVESSLDVKKAKELIMNKI